MGPLLEWLSFIHVCINRLENLLISASDTAHRFPMQQGLPDAKYSRMDPSPALFSFPLPQPIIIVTEQMRCFLSSFGRSKDSPQLWPK